MGKEHTILLLVQDSQPPSWHLEAAQYSHSLTCWPLNSSAGAVGIKGLAQGRHSGVDEGGVCGAFSFHPTRFNPAGPGDWTGDLPVISSLPFILLANCQTLEGSCFQGCLVDHFSLVPNKKALNKIYCCCFMPAICYTNLTLNEYKVLLKQAANVCVCLGRVEVVVRHCLINCCYLTCHRENIPNIRMEDWINQLMWIQDILVTPCFGVWCPERFGWEQPKTTPRKPQ